MAKNSAKSQTDKLMAQLIKLQNKNTAVAQKFSSKEASIARDFNAQEAATARDWQERMSNTSHRREVADLKAAGLNPVLSANAGGAQSYTTSSAVAQNANSNFDSALGAIGSLGSSLLSATATKEAAALNSAATRYASDNALRAAQEAAAATRYSADMHYKTEMDKPQSSWAAIADKYFHKLFPDSTDESIIDSVKIHIKDAIDVTIVRSKAMFDKFLDSEGQSIAGYWLIKNGFADTWKNKGYLMLALGTGNQKFVDMMTKK